MTALKAAEAERFVYVIGPETGAQKVGVTNSPELRRVALSVGGKALRIHATVAVQAIEALAVERYAHCLLYDHHVRGEWFDVSPQVATEAICLAATRIANGEAPPFIPLLMQRKPADFDSEPKGVRFPPVAVDALERAAAVNGLSVSSVIRMAVMIWLREQGYLK